MSQTNGDWTESFELTRAMMKPDRFIAAVDDALRSRGVAPGLVVMRDLDVVSGVLLELGDEMYELKVALGNTRGTLSVFTHDGKPTLDFSASDVEGDFEPLYFLFVALGRALGATPKELYDAADEVEDEFADAIALELSAFAPAAVDVTALDPLEESRESVTLEREGNDLHVTVGLGPRALRFRSHGGAGLPDDELRKIERQLTEALAERVNDARRGALARQEPPLDPARGGRWFIDVYGPGGAPRWSAELTDDNLAQMLERAQSDAGVAVVTRYFSDGRPFFRAEADEGSEPSFDDFHLFRTWSWLTS